MTSPQRTRQLGGPFPPLQTEALGLSIHPNGSEASPQPINNSAPRRGSAIRTSTMATVPTSQSQSQSHPNPSPLHYSYNTPPSPSHTAHSQSPPTSTISPSGFSQGNMNSQGQPGSFPRLQSRIPPPTTDNWTEPDNADDNLPNDERIVDQRMRGAANSLLENHRTSPISMNAGTRPAASRSRPRPQATSSSPVLSSLSRQQLYPNTMGPPTAAPLVSSMTGMPQPQQRTPPTVHGMPTSHSAISIASMNRITSDIPNQPLPTPPSSVHSHTGSVGRREATPPQRSQTPTYHAPFDAQADRNTHMNGYQQASKNYSPFHYDQETQSEYTENEVDISDVEPTPARVQHMQNMVKPAMHSNPSMRQVNRLPLQEEPELDDDVTPSGLLPHQQQAPRWTASPKRPAQQHIRRNSSPPPAAPASSQVPIPIFSPQSVSAAHPPLLGTRDPSPPSRSALVVSGQSGHGIDHDEAAEASSDHFTPKSPNAPLPADHPVYAPNGQYRSRQNVSEQYSHAMFAMQMGGMPAPRGPVHIPNESFTSFGNAAASLNGDTPTSHNGVGQDLWDEYVDFYNYQRMHPYTGHSRPSAPVPPTPHSLANAAQTPLFQATHGMNYEPPLIPERYIPSALSSYMSSPMMHTPFLPRYPPPQSIVSSPSHQPVELTGAPFNNRKGGVRMLKKKKGKSRLGPSGLSKQTTTTTPPPPALGREGAESTIPKETSSEAETDTDDDSGRTQRWVKDPKRPQSDEDEDTDDEDVWLSESSDDEIDEEYHSRYIDNPSKRKRKWDQKWEAMIRLFQELDRTTDSPMLLMAAPSTASSPKTHILVSRAIIRNPQKYMAHIQTARSAFSQASKARRKEKADQAAAEKARKAIGFEQQLAQAAFMGSRLSDSRSGFSGSPSSTMAGLSDLRDLPQLAAKGEDGLKAALGVALESLKQMHMIYEQREERRREEAERQRQEAAGLESLWRATAFMNGKGGGSDVANSPPPKTKSP